jgi:hypothetical protein
MGFRFDPINLADSFLIAAGSPAICLIATF